MRVDFPIAVDSDFGVWRAFGNEYWPAIYVVDAQGRIRHHQFGEGGYEDSERVIQQLLGEAGHPPPGREPTKVVGAGLEASADWNSLQSPETYLGAARAETFASPGGALVGKAHAYSVPQRLALNQWALSGTWTITPGAAVLNAAGGRIVSRFHARDLHLVMSPGRGASRCGSGSSSTDGRPALRTGSTWTRRATGRSASSGCTSSSARRRRLPTGSSRSSSWILGQRPLSSPSVDDGSDGGRAMDSRFLMTLQVAVVGPQKIGAVPHGTRVMAPIPSGHFEGPRLRGKVLPGGGDWTLLRSDGVLELDLRITLETDDGALIR